MTRELTPLELETLIRISNAIKVFYKFTKLRHNKSHRSVVLYSPVQQSVAAATMVEHVNVDVVDILRIEGYLQITDKNTSPYAIIVLTELGLTEVKKANESTLL